ncbi:hypothetical protein ACIPYQ_37665 [Streptomyces sp. NPDC090045]|uniref:hypothetical protein n=1 Tax=Streptomyces sp. NPDC090045 TaxID=3365927 RepID=UPI003821332A
MPRGQNGIRAIEEEWAASLPVRIAGRVRQEPAEVLDRAQARRLDRCEQLALVAARGAWADAGRGRTRGGRRWIRSGSPWSSAPGPAGR